MKKSKLMLLLIIYVMSWFQLFNFDPAWGQSKSQVSSSDTMKDDAAAMLTITTLQSLKIRLGDTFHSGHTPHRKGIAGMKNISKVKGQLDRW